MIVSVGLIQDIHYCWLFEAKSFGLVGFHGKSTIVDYLMPNHF